MRRLLTLLAALALPTTACVSQGTHDKLRAEHDAALRELQARDGALREREGQLASARTERQSLQEALAAERERAQALDGRIRKLEGDLAGMLKDRSSLQASVTEMQGALADAQKRKEEADARIAEYRGLLAKFRSLIDAGKLTVRIQGGRMVVVLASDVLFPSGSAQLSRDGRASIAEVGALLASIPERQFQVEGHTDNVPISTAQYPSNWELAAARALNVVKTMREAGMPSERISAAAFGDSRPAVPNDTPEGRAQNRRIEIIIVPDLSSLPGFEELQRVERGS